LPGTTIDWQGLLIALAVMDLPVIATDRYIKRKYYRRHPGRFALGGFLIVAWMLVGPAVADWVTPHFNIGGVWQYAVLLLAIFGLALAYSKIVMTVTGDPARD
jgi:MFS family permease